MAVIDYVERMEKTVRELVKQPWSKVVMPTPSLKAGTLYDERREFHLGKPSGIFEVDKDYAPTIALTPTDYASIFKSPIGLDVALPTQRYTALDYARENELRSYKRQMEQAMMFGPLTYQAGTDTEVVASEILDEICTLPIDEQITSMRHTLENL